MEESILKFMWNHRALMQAICSQPLERAHQQQVEPPQGEEERKSMGRGGKGGRKEEGEEKNALVILTGSSRKEELETCWRHRCVLADLFLSANRLGVLDSDIPNPLGPLAAQVREEVKQWTVSLLGQLLEEKTLRTLPWAEGGEEEGMALEDVDLLPPQAVKDVKLETLSRCLSFLLLRLRGTRGGGGELMVDSSGRDASSTFLPAAKLVDFLGVCVGYLCGEEGKEGIAEEEEEGEERTGAWGQLCARWQRLLDRRVSASQEENLRVQERDFNCFRGDFPAPAPLLPLLPSRSSLLLILHIPPRPTSRLLTLKEQITWRKSAGLRRMCWSSWCEALQSKLAKGRG
eukprot:660454-Hanusia_phi.AAC.4